MKFLQLNPTAVVTNTKTQSRWSLLFISFTSSIIIVGTRLVGSIVVPESWEPPEEDYTDKQLINLEAREIDAEMRNLSRSLPCVASFVTTYLDIQPYRLPVLLPENFSDLSEIGHLYLSALHNVKPTYVVSGQLQPTYDHLSSLTALIIVEDSVQLSNTSTELIDVCGRDCKYALILTNPFPEESSFLEECRKMILWLWDNRIANIVFLGSIGEKLFASRSLSFQREKESTPSDPQFVAVCGEDSNWTDDKGRSILPEDMYAPLKMNRCIVNVAFFEYEPYVSLRKHVVGSFVSTLLADASMKNVTSNIRTTNDSIDAYNDNMTNEMNITTSELIGIEGLLIRALASSLDFLIAEYEIPWKNETSIAVEVNEALMGKGMTVEIDMVLGGLPWAPINETEYTLPYDVVQIVWVIPIHAHISLHGLVSPLQNNVWFAVIGLLVFAGTIEMILTRDISFLEILSLVIGVAWPTQPSILSGRIRFISWVIFGYVLTQCYLASLSGQLMASSSIQIETLNELAKSWLTIGGIASTKDLFKHLDSSGVDDNAEDYRESNEINRIMMEKFHVFRHDEYTKLFNDLIDEKNFSLALAVTLNMTSMKPSFEGKHVHRMREALSSYPLSFAVWRGMPYLSALDKKISSLLEGGIIGYWARAISLTQGGYYDTDLDNDENNLRLSALVPGFLLLVMGYGIAGILLLFEIGIFHWRNRKKGFKKQKFEKSRSTAVDQEKFKPRLRAPKIVALQGKKLPETLDTQAWIERFNDLHQSRKREDQKPIKRLNYPFQFVD